MHFHNSEICNWFVDHRAAEPLVINIRELKHATFLSHGRQPEENILQARTYVAPRFSK